MQFFQPSLSGRNKTPILSLIIKGELDQATKIVQQMQEGMRACKKGENVEISSIIPEKSSTKGY